MPALPNQPNDPIKHVIVLMMENRSRNHLFGGLAGAIPCLDGMPKPGEPARSDRAADKTYKQVPGGGRSLNYDPKHEFEHKMHRLENDNGSFVADFAKTDLFSLSR